MAHWLIKSEPGTYAWADLVDDGTTYWDGVRNYQARNNIREMKKGDLALFYHSVNEKSVVGVARVVSSPYADPTAKEGDWSVVDFAPAYALRRPVTLEQIKDETALCDMVLVRQSRLSVQPVSKPEFDSVVRMGGKLKL